jgi:hypothetical protein
MECKSTSELNTTENVNRVKENSFFINHTSVRNLAISVEIANYV